METLKLEANYRKDMSRSRMKAIRKQGYATASVFGHDAEPVSIEVKLSDLIKQVKESEGGLKSLIDLKIKGGPKKSDGMVLIKEFHKHALTRKVLDIQFQRINLKEKIHVGVPIEIVGEAPGIKEGGMFELTLDELQISCLPTDIPNRFVVDVSGLEIGNLIRAGEIEVQGDIEVLTDPDAVVANCRPPHVVAAVEEEAVEEAAPAEEGAAAAPEAEAPKSEG